MNHPKHLLLTMLLLTLSFISSPGLGQGSVTDTFTRLEWLATKIDPDTRLYVKSFKLTHYDSDTEKSDVGMNRVGRFGAHSEAFYRSVRILIVGPEKNDDRSVDDDYKINRAIRSGGNNPKDFGISRRGAPTFLPLSYIGSVKGEKTDFVNFVFWECEDQIRDNGTRHCSDSDAKFDPENATGSIYKLLCSAAGNCTGETQGKNEDRFTLSFLPSIPTAPPTEDVVAVRYFDGTCDAFAFSKQALETYTSTTPPTASFEGCIVMTYEDQIPLCFSTTGSQFIPPIVWGRSQQNEPPKLNWRSQTYDHRCKTPIFDFVSDSDHFLSALLNENAALGYLVGTMEKTEASSGRIEMPEVFERLLKGWRITSFERSLDPDDISSIVVRLSVERVGLPLSRLVLDIAYKGESDRIRCDAANVKFAAETLDLSSLPKLHSNIVLLPLADKDNRSTFELKTGDTSDDEPIVYFSAIGSEETLLIIDPSPRNSNPACTARFPLEVKRSQLVVEQNQGIITFRFDQPREGLLLLFTESNSWSGASGLSREESETLLGSVYLPAFQMAMNALRDSSTFQQVTIGTLFNASGSRFTLVGQNINADTGVAKALANLAPSDLQIPEVYESLRTSPVGRTVIYTREDIIQDRVRDIAGDSQYSSIVLFGFGWSEIKETICNPEHRFSLFGQSVSTIAVDHPLSNGVQPLSNDASVSNFEQVGPTVFKCQNNTDIVVSTKASNLTQQFLARQDLCRAIVKTVFEGSQSEIEKCLES